MLLIFLGGLIAGIVALVALITFGIIREFAHWQNELILHNRWRPGAR